MLRGATGLGLLLAVASKAVAAPDFVPVEVVDIPEAGGVPAGPTCAEALERAAQAKAARGPWEPPQSLPTGMSPPDRTPSPEASPTRPRGDLPPVAPVPNPRLALSDLASGAVAGGDLSTLPVQPLEGTRSALQQVGDVLRLAEAGQPIRVSVWGASHTGGDYFTGRLRRALQQRYGDGGHGFVWPARLYAHHRASDVNLCRTDGWRSDWVGRKGGRHDGLYGFGGASVSSSDPLDFAWIETTRDNRQGRAFSAVDLFMLGHPEGGSLLVTVDDTAPRVVSTYEASPVLRHVRLKVPDGGHRVELRPLGDGEVRVLGASPHRSGQGVLVDSLGIRGRMARTWLSWDRGLVIPGIRALAPDLVVLAYGTNEAADTDYRMERYREDLTRVLSVVREGAPGAACVLIGPSDRAVEVTKGRAWRVWGRTAPVAQVQREAALASGCAFWDWQQASGGPGSMVAWRLHDPPLAGWDFIHFTQAGYEESADRFLQAWWDAVDATGGRQF